MVCFREIFGLGVDELLDAADAGRTGFLDTCVLRASVRNVDLNGVMIWIQI